MPSPQPQDIVHLFQEFGGRPESYRELTRTREADQARGRWPLISRLEELPPGAAVPPVRPGEDPGAVAHGWHDGVPSAPPPVPQAGAKTRVEPAGLLPGVPTAPGPGSSSRGAPPSALGDALPWTQVPPQPPQPPAAARTPAAPLPHPEPARTQAAPPLRGLSAEVRPQPVAAPAHGGLFGWAQAPSPVAPSPAFAPQGAALGTTPPSAAHRDRSPASPAPAANALAAAFAPVAVAPAVPMPASAPTLRQGESLLFPPALATPPAPTRHPAPAANPLPAGLQGPSPLSRLGRQAQADAEAPAARPSGLQHVFARLMGRGRE